MSPAESPKSALMQNLVTHSNALERSLIVDTIFTNELPAHRPVRPVMATGQTGYGDRSDRFFRKICEDLKPRAREGPRRSSWI